nr:putative nucleotidyltransferase, ribonuclease H [Tanacetum cinerariifolium]
MARPESSNAGRERNLDGGVRGNTQFSRVTKIEFSKFRGEDIRRWLFKCEQFFKVDNTTNNWEDVNWGTYRAAILKRFDIMYDDPLGELKRLKHTAHVQEYIDAFDRLMYRIDLAEFYCISFFLEGLSSEIVLAVRMFKLTTLAEKYTPGHKCSGQVYSLEVLGDTSSELLGEQLEEEVLETEEIIQYTLHISLNDINGGCEMVLGIQWLSTLVPTTLPPMRPCDHKIPLKDGTIPITSRLYRHPPTQKDAIEVMVKELFDTVVIKDNQNLFSSPMVMDKFPIRIIKELIDELQGLQFFTKLDLRFGYHQIRINPTNVEKTAFKTHEGHYEFLVMPFGLTNAPSTFQALMNLVFKEYLRIFALVLFDDILVYSPTMETHVQHLRIVLEALRQNTLYVKHSKCVFGTEKVKYLRHVITKDGVVTDGS